MVAATLSFVPTSDKTEWVHGLSGAASDVELVAAIADGTTVATQGLSRAASKVDDPSSEKTVPMHGLSRAASGATTRGDARKKSKILPPVEDLDLETVASKGSWLNEGIGTALSIGASAECMGADVTSAELSAEAAAAAEKISTCGTSPGPAMQEEVDSKSSDGARNCKTASH